jgi:hypothetical protein
MINWRRMPSSAAFLIGLLAGLVMARDGWDSIHWGPVLAGLGTGLLVVLGVPFWTHRREWWFILRDRLGL